MSRFVKPHVTRLPISAGDFIDVKQRLNTGEKQDMMARMAPYLTPGEKMRMESRQVMTAQVLAYLIGWSLTDDDGTPVAYSPDISPESRLAILESLDPDTFQEIKAAIDAHEEAQEQARVARKNAPDGESASSAPLPSVEPMAGAMSGSSS